MTRQETREFMTSLEDGMTRGGWKPTKEVVRKLLEHLSAAVERELIEETGRQHMDLALVAKEEKVQELQAKLVAQQKNHFEQLQNLARG